MDLVLGDTCPNKMGTDVLADEAPGYPAHTWRRLLRGECSTNKKFHWNSNKVECSGTNLCSL
jgi:hypothetical protein